MSIKRRVDRRRQQDRLNAYAWARPKQANALPETIFKALRRISLSPDVIGKILAAALLLLHVEHDRTT
jgi:hypothetical protein